VTGCDLLAPAADVGHHVRTAAAEIEKALGRVDVLVALAGLPATPELWQKPFEDVSASDLHSAFAVDTVGTFLFAQAFAPKLRASKGTVVVMSSSAAFYGDTLGLLYAPAKSANAGLVRMLARVLAPEVRVNGVAPGAIESGWLATLNPEQRRHAASLALLRRLGQPAEVAEAILSLAAPGYMNGQVLPLDGGIFPQPAKG
ncbi:MAG: SDR family NAD(P)-dependent oxidoreductase, partial [Candidatus Eiseniibacteriota bacterium]